MQRSPSVDEAACTTALARLGAVDGPSELYDALAGTVYGLALRLCDSPGAAASVCAAVFDYVCRNQGEYDPTRMTVSQWASQLTHRFAVLASGDAASTARRAGETVDCGSLTGRQREDLVDAYFGGLTYREIARRRGTAPDQIVTALQRSLHQLLATT